MTKRWSEMSRQEKLEALDLLDIVLQGEVRTMARDLTDYLAQHGIPFRVEVDARLVILDNLLDPRLP